MKITNSVFRYLDMAMLPIMEHTLVFGNDFLLTDNFGLPLSPQTAQEFTASAYPFKININIMLFCTRGSMRVRLNLKEFLLQKNQVLVMLPNTIGECLEFTDDCLLAMIAYTGNKFGSGLNASYSIMFQKLLSKRPVIQLSEAEMQESLTIYEFMRKKMEQVDFGFTREALNGYMQVLFSNGYQWLTNHIQKEEKELKTESRQQELFNRFLELVQKHYKEERGIAFYADKLCLTPKYLSLAIHQASGRYAGDWIKDYVILEAKALLKSKMYTVQQISDMLNFANASFFGKYFKAAAGCSPRKYMME